MQKSTKCKICRNPTRPYKTTCSIDCETELAIRLLDKRKRADAKQVRSIDKERKEKLKTLHDWIAEAQVVFNKFIRLRDDGLPCICCADDIVTNRNGEIIGWISGGEFDAGHYRSRGSAGHLRFNEDNCHKQKKQCNRWGAGRAVDYRIGLIQRIGLERVEALEANNTPHKWTVDELKEIIKIYRCKIKELTNRA